MPEDVSPVHQFGDKSLPNSDLLSPVTASPGARDGLSSRELSSRYRLLTVSPTWDPVVFRRMSKICSRLMYQFTPSVGRYPTR